MSRSRKKNNDFRFLRSNGFVRYVPLHQREAPRPIQFANHNRVVLSKLGGFWYAGRLDREMFASPPFPDTTAAYLWAQCEGWIT